MAKHYLRFSGALVLWLFLMESLWSSHGSEIEGDIGMACGLVFTILSPLQMWQRRPTFLDSFWRGSLWGVFVVYGVDLFWAYNFGHCGRTVWPAVLLVDVLPGTVILTSFWLLARNPTLRKSAPPASLPSSRGLS